MPSVGPTDTPSTNAMKSRMTMLETNLKKVKESGKLAADAAETMRATLEANYQRVQETQDLTKESMDTMERSMTVILMTQIQESNARVATVFEQTSKQATTMTEMQFTLVNINRVLLNSVTGYVNSQSEDVHIPMDTGPQVNLLKRNNAQVVTSTQPTPKLKSTSPAADKDSQTTGGGTGQ